MIAPDLVVLNGRIATMDAAGTEVEALAVHAGRIVARGSTAAMRDLAGAGTRVLDLEGRRAIPGIVDSHAHPDAYAIRLARWRLLEPSVIPDRATLLEVIARGCATLPPGRWFAGYRLNENKSGGYPTLDELDAASGGRPLFILRTDGHLGLANSAAFAACGIPADAADPPFGRFDRHPQTGRFTGLVRETAAHVFLNAIHDQDREADIASGMREVHAHCLRHGITSVYNSLTPSKAIRAYQRMKGDGTLAVRTGIIVSGREDGLVEAFIASGIRTGFGDDDLRVIGVEWCPDCSTSGRTAAYWEPYVGTPIPGEPVPNTGMLLYDAADLAARATAAHRAGLLVMIEGVGDRGIDFALDAIEAALAAHPMADHRMRVEHCCYVTPPILSRLRSLGVVDSSATGFMWELGDAYIANRGQAAMRHMWPHRTLIDAGVPAPAHSDFAVCTMNPWTAIHAMVNRETDTGGDLDRSEAVTVSEAIRAYTLLGAWSGREEASKGSLEIGKLADVTVLDRDPFAIEPRGLKDVRTAMTLVGGELRFAA
ncbi:amidohydrolase [Elioraea tepidiphila]|jgi:predicted amidohydrolase YtcJ|uniref:amidohydrolase n=1 Tax=Elioraea tepidiphila TaxID=457934 RepID=UPI00037B2A51|nr:amidohydrolase [Elioraea tepidiphila]